MKKLLLSTVALVGLTAGAFAADLPVRTAPMAPVVPVAPAFTWTGFYVGVNAGYGFQDEDDNNFLFGTGTGTYAVPTLGGGTAAYTLANPGGFFGRDNNNDGFVAGAQIGYNWQLTPGSGFVFGIEADIQGVFGNDDDNFFGFGGPTYYGVAPTAPGVTAPGFGVAPTIAGAPGNLALFDQSGAFNGRNGLDWFGTVRLRAGYAFDRFLVYATGGLAFGEGGNDNVFFGGSGAGIPAPFYVSPAAATAGSGVSSGFAGFGNNDDIRVGWTLGGGVEYAFTNNLTVKVEGLYVNLDQDNNPFLGNQVVGVTNTGAPVTRTDLGLVGNRDNDFDFWVVRAGLNYKFNTF